jgi:hypothetical protein
MSSGINLISTKSQSSFAPFLNRLKVLRFLAIGLLFFVAVCSMILFILISLSPLSALKQQEQTSLSTLAGYHTDIARLMILRERTDSIAGIISKRTDYTKVIDVIRNKLPSDSSITALQVGDKHVSVTISSPSLASVDSFVNGLVSETGINKPFLNATLGSIAGDETKGRYVALILLTTP